MLVRVLALMAFLSVTLPTTAAAPPAMYSSGVNSAHTAAECHMIEDFESYEIAQTPSDWNTNKGRELIPADEASMKAGRNMIRVQGDAENRFVRMEMSDYAYRLITVAGDGYEWNADLCPVLSWEWRIHRVPEGAREDRRSMNDVPAAVYVTFGRDWLGRPISIKYTFSSTLPVGTVTEYGPLKVLVVGSAVEGGIGEWVSLKRDVLKDYRRLFGKAPETMEPIAITLFSDANDVPNPSAMVDFDNLQTMSRL